jgi:hypothetical protein
MGCGLCRDSSRAGMAEGERTRPCLHEKGIIMTVIAALKLNDAASAGIASC